MVTEGDAPNTFQRRREIIHSLLEFDEGRIEFDRLCYSACTISVTLIGKQTVPPSMREERGRDDAETDFRVVRVSLTRNASAIAWKAIGPRQFPGSLEKAESSQSSEGLGHGPFLRQMGDTMIGL
jgi:hypothetical protein